MSSTSITNEHIKNIATIANIVIKRKLDAGSMTASGAIVLRDIINRIQIDKELANSYINFLKSFLDSNASSIPNALSTSNAFAIFNFDTTSNAASTSITNERIKNIATTANIVIKRKLDVGVMTASEAIL